jgi:hypothetical protein
MQEWTDAEVERVLREAGLARLLPVRRMTRRPGCLVFGTRVHTSRGDADVDIQVYRFDIEPETIADYEEEVTALTRGEEFRPILLREIRDRQHGILVTSPRNDAEVVEHLLIETGDARRKLTYHAQLDRVLGGDYFHQVQGHWMKACLCSIRRAAEMRDCLAEAEAAYRAASEWPGKLDSAFPLVLAILQVPPQPIEGLPAPFRELAVVQLVIQSPYTISIAPPQGERELTAFTHQLFGCMRAVHHAGLRLGRDAGTCIHPEFVLASGAFIDGYFLSNPADRAVLVSSRRNDIGNALLLISRLAGRHARLTGVVLREAIKAYAGAAPKVADVIALADDAARELEHGQTAMILTLAQEMTQV